jgi:hypothetical protein
MWFVTSLVRRVDSGKMIIARRDRKAGPVVPLDLLDFGAFFFCVISILLWAVFG